MKKGLTTCAFADMLKEQSRAEQSRVSETLPVCGAPVFAQVTEFWKKDAVPAWWKPCRGSVFLRFEPEIGAGQNENIIQTGG